MFEDFTYVNESAMTRNSSRNTHTIEEHGESDEASETQDWRVILFKMYEYQIKLNYFV